MRFLIIFWTAVKAFITFFHGDNSVEVICLLKIIFWSNLQFRVMLHWCMDTFLGVKWVKCIMICLTHLSISELKPLWGMATLPFFSAIMKSDLKMVLINVSRQIGISVKIKLSVVSQLIIFLWNLYFKLKLLFISIVILLFTA